MKKANGRTSILYCFAVFCFLTAHTLFATTFVVTTNSDEFNNPSGPNVSLREAIRDAYNNPGADTIVFDPSLNGATITATNSGVPINNSDTGGLIIDATSLPAGITIDGNNAVRAFDNLGIVTVRGVTFTHGFLGTCCGGQGVLNRGPSLTLERCTVTGNLGGYGAVFTENNCVTTLKECTVAGNTGWTEAGGIFNRGTTILVHCTISANQSQGDSGGIYNQAGWFLSMQNCIVCGNTAATTGPDINNFGTLTNLGVNIVQAGVNGTGTNTGGGTISTVNPLLGALANNGGPTRTMLPQAGSPAIDAAVGSTETIDQRGFSRPVDSDNNGTVAADIGAVEIQQTTSVNFAGSISTQNYKFNRPATTFSLSGTNVYFTVISFTTVGTGNLSVTTSSSFPARLHLYNGIEMNPFDAKDALFQNPTLGAQTAASFGGVSLVTNQLVISGTSPTDVGSFSGTLTFVGPGPVALQTDYHDKMAEVATTSTEIVALPGALVTNSVYAKGILPHSFQWYNGYRPSLGTAPDPANIIAGATSSTYVRTATNSGGITQPYWCWMTGKDYPGGTVTNVRSSTFLLNVANTNVAFSGSIDAGDCQITSAGCNGFPGSGNFESHRFHIYTDGYYSFSLTPGFSAMVYQGFYDPANGNVNCWGGLSGIYPPGDFELVVTGSGNYTGTISSTNALSFIPPIPPSFLQNPLPTTIPPGSSAVMTCSTTCGTPRSLQWYKGISGDTSNPIPGAINSTYVTPALNVDSFYWVRLTHTGGTVDSGTGPVYVTSGPIEYYGALTDCDKTAGRAERINQQIGVTPDCHYKLFVFTVSTTGNYTFDLSGSAVNAKLVMYQGGFFTNNPIVNLYQTAGTTMTVNLAQSAQPWYLIIAGNTASDLGNFHLVASGPQFVTKFPAPIINTQPLTTNIYKGQIAKLSVASTSLNLAYQWFTGLDCPSKTAISGAYSNSYTTPPMTSYSNYWVELDNNGGYLFSQMASVQIIPQALNDSVTTSEEVPVTYNVVANDIKADNRTIVPIITTNPVHGTVVNNGDGTITYTPATNYYGPDSFSYAAYDGALTSTNATVSITVQPVADTPSATSAATQSGQQTTNGLVLSVNPVDGASVTRFKITGIQNGFLYQHDGVTSINNGDFITVAQGQAGLRFTPPSGQFNPFYTFGFTVQAAINASDVGLSPAINVPITVGSAPVIITSSVTNISMLQATVNALAQPRDTNATAYFEYGRTTSYGSKTPTQTLTVTSPPTQAVPFSAQFRPLPRAATIHYRIVVSNSTAVSYSTQTFSTLAVDPSILPMTTVNYYRLGDADPGATDGGFIISIKDSVGTNDLHQNNSPTYSANVTPAATEWTNNGLGIVFNGSTQSVSGPGLSPVTNNFCLEAWVNPRSGGGVNRVIAYNGLANNSGWGMFQNNGNFGGYYAGVAAIPNITGVPLPVNTWTHLALVQSNGTARFYTNGVLAGTPVVATPKPPDGSGFGIAADANSSNPNVSKFDGWIDEVRFSIFASGKFDERSLMAIAGAIPFIKTSTSSSSGLLNASAFASGVPGAVYFEYGDTTNYGSYSTTKQLTTNLNFIQPVSIQLTAPPGSANIHYRAVLDFGALGKVVGVDAIASLLKITEAKVAAGSLVIKATGTVGHSYQLQSTTNLTPPASWVNVGSRINAAADGGIQSTNTISGSPRFYRFSE